MKKFGAILLAGVVTLGIGAGAFFGAEAYASNANPEIPADIAALKMADIEMLSNIGDATYYMALTGVDSGIQVKKEKPTTIVDMSSFGAENPTDGNLSEEEAKQIGITAIAQKYGLTQKDIDTFDVAVRGNKASVDASAVTDILWVVRLTPVSPEDNHVYMQYHAVIDDKLEEDVYVYGTPLSKEGTPSANELSSDKAIEIGITALVKEYTLTQETLDRFTVTSQYYEIAPEAPGKHVWWVNLYPTNTDEFSEIGCYWMYIDAETGEVLQLNSAANGKG